MDGRKWLFAGQLDGRFLPYLVDYLQHVRSKIQGKSDFFSCNMDRGIGH